jgi:excisionase family DNA binding protein
LTKILGPAAILSAPVCAEIGPSLLDYLEDRYRRNGLPIPDRVRAELLEVFEIGAALRDAARRQRRATASDVRSDVRLLDLLDSPRSSMVESRPMKPPRTYSTKEAAALLGVGERAVQQLATRGSVAASREGHEWRFDADAIDKRATGARA